ncbi:gas vesicle protein [Kribbella sp. NPDC026611]|uniref:gas vesicle protein n=1 Tax=Kribbella sp. NPDC026611 TaxID=3154911 RepID=UPI0033C32A9E
MTVGTELRGDVRTGPQPVALVDLLDRLLGSGVVIAGDVIISLANVELIHIQLAALIHTVTEELETLR